MVASEVEAARQITVTVKDLFFKWTNFAVIYHGAYQPRDLNEGNSLVIFVTCNTV